MSQVEVIKKCLDLFGMCFGQKVSQEKTRIFFSNNVHHAKAMEIASEFGFSLSSDLGKYLGVPLQHKRASKGFFSHVTDRVMRKLSA